MFQVYKSAKFTCGSPIPPAWERTEQLQARLARRTARRNNDIHSTMSVCLLCWQPCRTRSMGWAVELAIRVFIGDVSRSSRAGLLTVNMKKCQSPCHRCLFTVWHITVMTYKATGLWLRITNYHTPVYNCGIFVVASWDQWSGCPGATPEKLFDWMLSPNFPPIVIFQLKKVLIGCPPLYRDDEDAWGHHLLCHTPPVHSICAQYSIFACLTTMFPLFHYHFWLFD